jgi:hypothetical protein
MPQLLHCCRIWIRLNRRCSRCLAASRSWKRVSRIEICRAMVRISAVCCRYSVALFLRGDAWPKPFRGATTPVNQRRRAVVRCLGVIEPKRKGPGSLQSPFLFPSPGPGFGPPTAISRAPRSVTQAVLVSQRQKNIMRLTGPRNKRIRCADNAPPAQ